MSKKAREKNYLKLRDPHDNLDFGRLIAEQDDNLAQYYVSPEKYLRRALDVNDPACFFVGPKGMGKSAVLKMLSITKSSDAGRVIELKPDDLAFSALANAEATSPILGEAGKNQWLFKALWDYVLALEVLKREFPTPLAMNGWFANIFQGQYEREARKLISLSQGVGTSLTERILQLVKEVELSGEYGGAKVAGTLTLDKPSNAKAESFHLLSLVNSVARKLRDNLDHVYYILIDDLDLYWSDTPTQNAFLAALFTSLSHFSRPPSLKAVVALRQNIYDSLPLIDRDKFHDAVCHVRWDYAAVRDMIESRAVFKLQVTHHEIWGGVFPQDAFKDMWSNSNGRPREAIRLATLAATIAQHNGHTQVLPQDMTSAVRAFSSERLKEVAGEFSYKYPGLELILRKMSGWRKEFPASDLSGLVELIDLEIQCKEPGHEKYAWVGGYGQNPMGFAMILLQCGMLWVKQSRTDEAKPLDVDSPIELNNNRWFAIHPMFGPALGLIGA